MVQKNFQLEKSEQMLLLQAEVGVTEKKGREAGRGPTSFPRD